MEQFGGASVSQGCDGPRGCPTADTMDDLEGCCGILAIVAVAGKGHLRDLVEANLALTKTVACRYTAFNYNVTSLGPLGISVITHIKLEKWLSCQLCGKDGWSASVSLEHYRCQCAVPKCSRLLVISD